jgi:hypothetical protein
MSANEDVAGLCQFLKATPEGNLRKMLVQGKLTDLHFRTLMKLAKGGAETDFIEAYTAETMGKLRISPKEAHIKETFWPIVKQSFQTLGLISAQKAS